METCQEVTEGGGEVHQVVSRRPRTLQRIRHDLPTIIVQFPCRQYPLELLQQLARRNVEPITIADPNLEAAIRATLSLSDSERPLTDQDLAKLTDLPSLYGWGVKNLSGIEHCTELEVLKLHDSPVTDLAPLSGLTKLKTLRLLPLVLGGHAGVALSRYAATRTRFLVGTTIVPSRLKTTSCVPDGTAGSRRPVDVAFA
jgi:hypothetical protein